MLAETRKAWVSAILAGAAAAMAAAAQMDWTAIGANEVRDLVVTFALAALAAGGFTYSVPNKPASPPLPVTPDTITHTIR